MTSQLYTPDEEIITPEGIPFSALPKQRLFLDSKAKFRGYIGGVGSGKTLVLCREAIKNGELLPKGVSIITRETNQSLKDTTLKTFLEICPEHLLPKRAYNQRDQTVRFPNGHMFYFRSTDNPMNFKSSNANGIYMDEGSESKFAAFKMLYTRLRKAPWQKFVITTNPEGKNWVWEHFVKAPVKDNYECFIAPTAENTHLDADYIPNMKAVLSQAEIDRYIYAKFNDFEGKVFSEFKADRHVITNDQYKQMLATLGSGKPMFFRAIDYGYADPMCCLWATAFPDGSLVIHDELYLEKVLICDFVKMVFERGEFFDGASLIDPSTRHRTGIEGRSLYDEFCANGYFAVLANNERQASVNRIQTMFKLNKLYIVEENCPMILKEMDKYMYKKPTLNRTGRKVDSETPYLKDDHAIDTLRYIVTYFYTFEQFNNPQEEFKSRLQKLCVEDIKRIKEQNNQQSRFYDPELGWI